MNFQSCSAQRSLSQRSHPLLLIVLLATALTMNACSNDSTKAENQPGPGDRPPTPVAVTPAFSGAIASHYEATATLEAEKQAEILARIQGVVGALSCEEGDQVVAGQQLLTVDNNEYRLRLVQAAAQTANLAAQHERLRRMLDEELTSTAEYETARSELATAEANEGLAQLNVSYTTITAPFDGRIVQRLVDPGQNVSIGTPLFLLADFDPLLARVHVPARELRNIRLKQPVTLVLDSDDTRLQGHVSLISPVIDATSGTIKITVEIEQYPPDTRPGDFAEVRIITEQRKNVSLVPTGAVFTDKGNTIVFVAVDGPNGPKAEQRLVEIGFSNTEFTQILSGVEPGEAVVIKGQRSLKSGVRLKILGAGAPADTSGAAVAPGEQPGPKPGQGRGRGGGGGHGRGGGGH